MLQPLALLLALALPARPSLPQEQEQEGVRDPEAIAVLEAAAAAAAQIRNASYESFAQVTIQGASSGATGSVAFAKLTSDDPGSDLGSDRVGARLYVRGTTAAPSPEDGEVTFRVAYDGNQVRARFGSENVVWQAPIPGAGREMLEIAEPLLMAELHAPEPFAPDLAAETIELGDDVDVRGEPCRVVRVRYGASGRFAKVEWAFSAEDHLPRRRSAEEHRRGAFRNDTLEIAALQINPTIHQRLFQLPTRADVEVKEYASQRQQGPALLQAGTPAPDFTLADASGAQHSLADFRGKVLVLDFWGTWCPPCRQAMPLVQKIHERFADDERVVVYGVATNERPDAKPAEFMEKGGFTYGLLLKGERIAADYKASSLPTFYVIGKDGNVLHASMGFHPALDIQIIEEIERYLASDGG